MRYAPPPVQYPVERPRIGAAPALWAGMIGASAWGAWVLQASVVDARQLVAGAACLAAILWAFFDWRNAPRGWLVWNGAHWHWRQQTAVPAGVAADPAGTVAIPAGCDVRIALHLDLQAVMLVRLAPTAGGDCPRWLWLERRQSPHTWADLRRAVLHAPPPGATAVSTDRLIVRGTSPSGVERAAP